MSLTESHVYIQAPPTVVVSEFYGVPHYLRDERSSTPGVLQTVFSDTIPATKTRYLGTAILDCRVEAEFLVKVDGILVGSARTGAGNPNALFRWSPLLAVPAGSTITMEVKTRSGSPTTTIRSYINGSQKD